MVQPDPRTRRETWFRGQHQGIQEESRRIPGFDTRSIPTHPRRPPRLDPKSRSARHLPGTGRPRGIAPAARAGWLTRILERKPGLEAGVAGRREQLEVSVVAGEHGAPA